MATRDPGRSFRPGEHRFAELTAGGGWYKSSRTLRQRNQTPITYEALLHVRPAPSQHVSVDALLLVRTDGTSIRVRDIPQLGLGLLLQRAQHLWHWVAPFAASPQAERPGLPGRRGYPDVHWEHVWKLWREAQETAPQRPIAWMREQYPDDSKNPRPSAATMHRWRDTAVQRHAQQTKNKGQLVDSEGRIYDSNSGAWHSPSGDES